MASGSPLAPRTRPMEVLVLGLCRTGTLSMKTALDKLGYNTYHMFTCFESPGDDAKWYAALKARYEGEGQPFTKEQWDDLLGEYSALSDVPAALFAEELVALYPEAKIILTTRPVDHWYTSMQNTIGAALVTPPFLVSRFILRDRAPVMMKMLNYFFEQMFYGNFDRFGKRVFEEHNENVRKIAKIEGPERFLEFQVMEGWEPLCKFLGKEVPEEEFPRVNDTASFRSHDRSFEVGVWFRRMGVAVMVVAPIAVTYGLVLRRMAARS